MENQQNPFPKSVWGRSKSVNVGARSVTPFVGVRVSVRGPLKVTVVPPTERTTPVTLLSTVSSSVHTTRV